MSCLLLCKNTKTAAFFVLSTNRKQRKEELAKAKEKAKATQLKLIKEENGKD